MAMCKRCREFMPPGFVENDKCIFCVRDTDYIIYDDGNKKIKKVELVNEYAKFLNTVRDRNDILKKALSGDVSEVPQGLILE